MRAMLRISILLNLLLLGGSLFLLAAWGRAHTPAAPPAPFDEAPAAVEAAAPTTGLPAKGEEQSFNWSQVESSDYRTYIANLRSIGCPEQTIRDIITADIDSQYATRREALEQKRASTVVVERTSQESGLQAMRKEEASLISGLLGAPATAVKTSPAAAQAPASGSVRQESAGMAAMSPDFPNGAPSAFALNARTSAVAFDAVPSGVSRKALPAAISVPLVFQPIEPSGLTLSSQQAQVVNDLRQKFVEDVGGPNQDPSNPAYSQRWQLSQPQSDLDLRGMIGIRAWEGYQIAAWAKAQQQTPSGP